MTEPPSNDQPAEALSPPPPAPPPWVPIPGGYVPSSPEVLLPATPAARAAPYGSPANVTPPPLPPRSGEPTSGPASDLRASAVSFGQRVVTTYRTGNLGTRMMMIAGGVAALAFLLNWVSLTLGALAAVVLGYWLRRRADSADG